MGSNSAPKSQSDKFNKTAREAMADQAEARLDGRLKNAEKVQQASEMSE